MTSLKTETPIRKVEIECKEGEAAGSAPSLFDKVWRSIVGRGPVGTLLLAPKNILWMYYRWRDRRFDRRYGVDTSGLVGLNTFNVVGGKIDNCNYYVPVPEKSVRRIIGALSGKPGDYTFVDIGAGKGRPVLLAAKAGFKCAIGVEFAPELVEVAEQNATVFRTKVPAAAEIEMVCDDATVWPIPAEDCFLFLANPFTNDLMRKFIDHVGRSYEQHGQHIVIAYYHPTCAAILDEAPFLTSREYRKLPFDPTPEITFEIGTEGHGINVPYDVIIYQTEPRRSAGG